MAVDKLHFLTGKLSELTNKTISRGDVYFAIDGEKGQIIFDAPINSSITKRIVMSGFESAESDSAGNVFINKYPFYFNTESTGTSFKIKITSFSKDDVSTIDVVNADADHAGLITNAAQEITGLKTFKSGITIDASSGFLYSGIESATGNSARPVWFAYDGVNGKPVYNANFTYNPSTKTLVAENITGKASQAIADSAGNEFISKYPYLFQETVGITDYKIHISSVSQDTVKVKDTSGNEVNNLVVPAASVDNAGLLTTGTQILSGLKTFQASTGDAGVIAENTASGKGNKIGLINDSSGKSGIYSYKNSKWVSYIDSSGDAYFKGTADLTNGVNATPASGDDEFTHVWFSDNTIETKRVSDDKFIYNSGTKTLNVNQYRINDHGLISYDANTESIVFSFTGLVRVV